MLAPADQQDKILQNRNKQTKCVEEFTFQDDPGYDKCRLI